MSMPKFPDIDPKITCDSALNMILTSIAMEELALSHIMNAEGEKLQYVLGTLEQSSEREFDIKEILAVNKSITCLLDSVSQNQMILKNKMDKAIDALTEVCPDSPVLPCKCNAFFKIEKCGSWCPDSILCWQPTSLHGDCISHDSCDSSKIVLRSAGRFIINFAVNVCAKSNCTSKAAISLQAITEHECVDLYTIHGQVNANALITLSQSGIIIDTFTFASPTVLVLRLTSSDALTVENAVFSIIEI